MTTSPQPADPTADVDITAASGGPVGDEQGSPADPPPLTTDAEAQLDDSLVDPGAS